MSTDCISEILAEIEGIMIDIISPYNLSILQISPPLLQKTNILTGSPPNSIKTIKDQG
jgi:hypothetical protein